MVLSSGSPKTTSASTWCALCISTYRAGGAPPTAEPKAGCLVFMVEQSDLLASVGYHRAGDLSLRSWLSSLQGTRRELAWFARDDLAPFLLMCVWFLLRGVQRALRLQQGRSSNASTPGTYR
jgi:hypothetical protein